MTGVAINIKCLRRRYFDQEEIRSATLPRAQAGAHQGRAFSLGGHRLLSLYRRPRIIATMLKFDLKPPFSSWSKYLLSSWSKYLRRVPGRNAAEIQEIGSLI